MADSAAVPADPCHTDVQRRWRELSACASGIAAARISLQPAPEDFEAVGDDLRLLARKVDALVESYGAYAQANAPEIDRTLFDGVLFNALDGNALYELERAAQQLRDDRAEDRYYARYRRRAAE